jgi:hypothetical protein
VRSRSEYDRRVIVDPLKSALEEIAPKLDAELQSLVAALLANEQLEDAWQALLQEVLDEA